MKFPKTLAAAALTAAFAIPFSGMNAGAADTTSLTVVDAIQYSGTNLLSHTICIDDVRVQSGDSVINPAIDIAPGTHTMKVARGPFTGDPAFGCNDPAPNSNGWVSSDVVLADVAAQTLVLEGWDPRGDPATLTTTSFTDDMSCTDPDTARIVARNFANPPGNPDVNFGSSDGAATDPELTPLISGLGFGDEGTAVVDAGTFPAEAGSVAAGWVEGADMPYYSNFDSIDAAAGSVTFVYSVGGGDGSPGQFSVTMDGTVCEAETTTTMAPATTAAPTTTTPAPAPPAARPVAAAPTYTG